MEEQPKAQQVGYAVLAVVLWLITIALAMECVYVIKEIFYLIYSSLGGSVLQAERYALILIFILAVGTLVFIIGTSEYHRKYFGKSESWRLYARCLAVELSIIVLYYIL